MDSEQHDEAGRRSNNPQAADSADERAPEWTGGQEVAEPVDEDTDATGAGAPEVPEPEEDEESQVELDSSE